MYYISINDIHTRPDLENCFEKPRLNLISANFSFYRFCATLYKKILNNFIFQPRFVSSVLIYRK